MLGISGLNSTQALYLDNELVRKYFKQSISEGVLPTLESVANKFRIEFGHANFHPEITEWINNILKSSFLEEVLSKDLIEEIHLCEDQSVFLKYKNDKILSTFTDVFDDYPLDTDIFNLWIKFLILKAKENWNYNQPFTSFGMELHRCKLRITLIHHSVSESGHTKIYIRKLSKEQIPIENFSYHEELKKLIVGKSNTIFCGPTGSGKTTLIQSLFSEFNPTEHVITLEDTHELSPVHTNWTSLISQREHPKKTLEKFTEYAMRMSPDRMIIGELRGSEVIPYILTMNNGHRGLLSTLHADNPHGALERMALLFMLHSKNNRAQYEIVFKLICQSIDNIVIVKDKDVSEIYQVIGAENGRAIIRKQV